MSYAFWHNSAVARGHTKFSITDLGIDLAHVGSTAAYLSRDGYVVSLTKNDTFEGDGLPVLTRAVGVAPTVEVAVCSFSLNEGDALVLSGRRLREAEERRRLSECLAGAENGSSNEQLLVVHYTPPATAQVPVSEKPHHVHPLFTGVVATLVFYALLCLH
jgi:hypothetical protein